MSRRLRFSGAFLAGILGIAGRAQTVNGPAARPQTVQELSAGRQALAAKHYPEAERCFRQALREDAANVNARMGLADAELGLRRYEEAELDYRKVVAAQPRIWVAHKNLVIVEAALGRWEEFDRERAVLRLARESGAEEISARESDVIDGFIAGGRHWIVREYFEPVGRTQTRYNFETFEADGRAGEYISLESETASRARLQQNQGIAVGETQLPARLSDLYALNWYTGKAHGVVKVYPAAPNHGEPTYEQIRADVLHWLHTRKEGTTR